MATTKRTISPRERDRQQGPGYKHLAPGIWEDADGNVHLSVPDLLAHFGWPNDAEHLALVTAGLPHCHVISATALEPA